MRKEIEDLIDNYEYIVKENEMLKEVVAFWRAEWFDFHPIPEKFDEDRRNRIRRIFIHKDPLSTRPDEDLVEACCVFEEFPTVGEK